MATTARDVINRSLRILGVLASGEAATASEANDALVALNSMIDSWQADYAEWFTASTFSTLNTSQYLPRGYEAAIVYNLCVELAPEYGVNTSPDIVSRAKESFGVLKRRNITSLRSSTREVALLGRINDSGTIENGFS